MTTSSPNWSLHAVLISVSNLTRSVDFYRDVISLREVTREGAAVVLQSQECSFAVVLRESNRSSIRHGQQELGPRTICFDVGSPAGLDAVAVRLQAVGGFVSRGPLKPSESFEIVTGRDPDGLPLLFVTYETNQPLDPDHYGHVALRMYSVDL